MKGAVFGGSVNGNEDNNGLSITTSNAQFNVPLGTYRTTTTTSQSLHEAYSDVGGTQALQFRVLADSTVGSRLNSYGGLSDARLKRDIYAAREYLDDLVKVRVVKFKFIGSDDTELLGVVAQELLDIFPGLVSEIIDEGTGASTYNVKTSVFTFMLISAVQTLHREREATDARIADLETDVAQLTSTVQTLHSEKVEMQARLDDLMLRVQALEARI